MRNMRLRRSEPPTARITDMTDRLQALLDITELSDRLDVIGEKHMGDFSAAEAGFYHAACDVLRHWVAAINTIEDDKL